MYIHINYKQANTQSNALAQNGVQGNAINPQIADVQLNSLISKHALMYVKVYV